jgi:hypothetical protein
MYFGTKSYLKNTCNHTVKHARNTLLFFKKKLFFYFKLFFYIFRYFDILILKIIFFIKKYYLNTFPNIKYLEKQLLSNSQTPHKTTNKYELASGHDPIFFC